jgi:hypothetical protein
VAALCAYLYLIFSASTKTFCDYKGLIISERIVFVTSGAYDLEKEGISNNTGNYDLTISGFAMSVATNGLATAAIAYKAW